jgi:hypothetical protein
MVGHGLEGREITKVAFLRRVYTDCGVHPASFEMGTTLSTSGLKRPGLEAEHSSSNDHSAE